MHNWNSFSSVKMPNIFHLQEIQWQKKNSNAICFLLFSSSYCVVNFSIFKKSFFPLSLFHWLAFSYGHILSWVMRRRYEERDISVKWMEFEVEEMFTSSLTLRKISVVENQRTYSFPFMKNCTFYAHARVTKPIKSSLFHSKSIGIGNVFFNSPSLSLCLWNPTCHFARISFNFVVLARQSMFPYRKRRKIQFDSTELMRFIWHSLAWWKNDKYLFTTMTTKTMSSACWFQFIHSLLILFHTLHHIQEFPSINHFCF